MKHKHSCKYTPFLDLLGKYYIITYYANSSSQPPGPFYFRRIQIGVCLSCTTARERSPPGYVRSGVHPSWVEPLKVVERNRKQIHVYKEIYYEFRSLCHVPKCAIAEIKKKQNKTILKPTVYRNISKGQKH